MTSTSKLASLKSFVKDTLGCGCPDQVFEKIEVDRHRVNGYPDPLTRIVVGDTLLIYLTHTVFSTPQSAQIHCLASAGKSDRDSHHYNRFRLVISARQNDSGNTSLSLQFDSHFGNDTKMHIHFIDKELVAELGIEL